MSTLNDIAAALIDGVDSILLGVPSSVLLRKVAEDYRTDYSTVQSIYNNLNTMLNAYNIQKEDAQNRKSFIISEISNYAPMSGLKSRLTKELDSIKSKETALNQKISETTDKALAAEKQMSELSNSMNKSLGTEFKERILNDK